MLKGIIICEDQELTDRLGRVLGTTEKISIRRKFSGYPDSIELLRMLRTQAPDVIFLSFESAGKALELLKSVESEGNRAVVIGISSYPDVAMLQGMMRAGVRECLSEPFDRQHLLDTFQRLKAKPDTHSETGVRVFSFLPAKAGVGASTVALNVSAALARQPGTRVLLSDFDLSSGMLDFMLKLESTHSVVDAVERAGELDEDLWAKVVCTVDKLDVLHAGHKKAATPSIDASQVRRLISLGAGIYQAMCFDLSGNMEPYSLEILRESKRIILVCTPEASALHLARKKLAALRVLGLEDRVVVVTNRSASRDVLNQKQIQELLGVPVMKTIPNNYPEVNRAIEAGKWVSADSKLGRIFEQLACDLLEQGAPRDADDKKKRLTGLFSTAREAVSGRLG
jgi:pilus assembly protein CpaE